MNAHIVSPYSPNPCAPHQLHKQYIFTFMSSTVSKVAAFLLISLSGVAREEREGVNKKVRKVK
jgi:hypothetical protein